MNLQRSSSIADNTVSARHKNDGSSKLSGAGRAQQQSVIGNRQRQNDQQHFQEVIDELRQGHTQSESEQSVEEQAEETHSAHSEMSESLLDNPGQASDGESAQDPFSPTDDEGLSSLSSALDNESARAESKSGNTAQNPDTAVLMETPFTTQSAMPGQLASGAQAGFIGSLPVNEAAARIIEEMQLRSRRGEARRWQFSLPGLMGEAITVTIECTENQSWNVQLQMSEGCTDEDKLALQSSLAQSLDDVSVAVVAL